MRILDENNIELKESDIDYTLGRLQQEKIIKKHHEAVDKAEEEFHYKVKTFYFTDGTSINISNENDPRVKIVDKENDVFEFVPQTDEEKNKIIFGIDIEKVIDKEEVAPQEAYDEYETIQRFIPFSDEELAKRKAIKEASEKDRQEREAIPGRISGLEQQQTKNSSDIEDLTVMISELVGTEE